MGSPDFADWRSVRGHGLNPTHGLGRGRHRSAQALWRQAESDPGASMLVRLQASRLEHASRAPASGSGSSSAPSSSSPEAVKSSSVAVASARRAQPDNVCSVAQGDENTEISNGNFDSPNERTVPCASPQWGLRKQGSLPFPTVDYILYLPFVHFMFPVLRLIFVFSVASSHIARSSAYTIARAWVRRWANACNATLCGGGTTTARAPV